MASREHPQVVLAVAQLGVGRHGRVADQVDHRRERGDDPGPGPHRVVQHGEEQHGPDAIGFLASPLAAYTTGSFIDVSGGHSRHV